METYQLEVTEGVTYQDMESKLEKHTHILGRAKWKLSGHRKKGISRRTHSLEEVEVETGQDIDSKQASKGHSHSEEGRSWDWWKHGK